MRGVDAAKIISLVSLILALLLMISIVGCSIYAHHFNKYFAGTLPLVFQSHSSSGYHHYVQFTNEEIGAQM